MPQGKILTINPFLPSEELKLEEDPTLTEEEKSNDPCDGEVEILSGQYSGQTGYFRGRNCCRKKAGDRVELDIIRVDKDGIFVRLKNC